MSRRFQTTHWSLILEARKDDGADVNEALEDLCAAYWYPLYGFTRGQGYSPDRAADMVQGFFTVLLEKRYLDAADPAKGRFRSFLLAALKHFLSNERDRERALKRGGGLRQISLDAEEAEGRLRLDPPDGRTPETIYERRWAFIVIDRVLDRLKAERTAAGKEEEYEQLRGFLTGEQPHLPYRQLGERLGVSEGSIKVAVHRLRARFGALLREEILATVVDADQIDSEIRHLLGALGGPLGQS